MAELLYPQRQRCKECGKGLGLTPGAPVYDGLYCTPRCAGIPVPSSDPMKVPRECRAYHDGTWALKRRYRCEEEIPDRLREDPSTSWYRCSCCHHLHIGHTRMGEAEAFRKFMDVGADLPDMLVKLRGQATVAQVAKAAGIRPIRLKELEAGTVHPDFYKNLNAVLRVYRASLGGMLTKGRLP